MPDLVEALLTPTFIFLCLGIAALTYILRKGIDYILSNPKIQASPNSKIWKDVILPAFPIIIGALIMYFNKNYPLPKELEHGRVLYGLCAGLFSGLVYRIIKSLVGAKDTSPTKDANSETTAL